VRKAIQKTRQEYRERAHVESAKRLRGVSSADTLEMTAELIDSAWSLWDAGEAALVRRRR